jgi:hypothetical protein
MIERTLMNMPLIPEDRAVTLTWRTTTLEKRTLTLPYSQPREAVNGLRDRAGLAHQPDLGGDLRLLEENRLGDYEEDGSLREVTRALDGHDLPAAAQLPVFTVSLDDSDDERECPHTHVLHAPDLQAATALVIAHYRQTFPAEYPDPDCAPDVLEGTWWTFPGAPSWPREMSGREWSDLRGQEHLLEQADQAAVQR